MDKMTVTARLLALLPHKQDSDLQLIFLLLPPKEISAAVLCVVDWKIFLTFPVSSGI